MQAKPFVKCLEDLLRLARNALASVCVGTERRSAEPQGLTGENNLVQCVVAIDEEDAFPKKRLTRTCQT
jgi:hypothetical protein